MPIQVRVIDFYVIIIFFYNAFTGVNFPKLKKQDAKKEDQNRTHYKGLAERAYHHILEYGIEREMNFVEETVREGTVGSLENYLHFTLSM